ncbi:CRM-domain containing factor CFM2, chloroplastic [Senna tora]|uniref:CRM-domain containing factor CFM2, chloroplastic n=1 Tax=Senna tora TaxID=362788 RepID=A0A834WHK0_9FABA|nr:CRM-domain containing factor CFM2, chloroplastic [Senna tora]
MLLPATHFHAFSLPPKLPSQHSSSSSSSFFFPIPISKTLIPRNPRAPKFLVRSSAADVKTLPKSAIERIAEKLRSLGYTEESQTPNSDCESTQSNSAGEIFVPLPQQLPKYRIGHTIDSSWSSPENPVPQPGSGTAIVRYNELTSEVEKQKKLAKEQGRNKREEKVPTLAELSLSQRELRRLTTLGIRMKQKLKIGKAGITEGIVNGIHERWRGSEVVKIFCEDISRLNMKRTHELLEIQLSTIGLDGFISTIKVVYIKTWLTFAYIADIYCKLRKTGGLVVWRSGSKIILYRGPDYKYPYFLADKVSRVDNLGDALQHSDCDKIERQSSGTNSEAYAGQISDSVTEKPSLIQGVGSPNKVRFQLPGEAELADEADRLLMGLGPRFTDWWGYDPLPVDADLLPAVIPGYRKPFRLLPYGVNPKLTNDEMTTLRRLGKPLPCHFALGRNRNLQGLAAAIVKLWERCEIAKIAIKRGVQNTNSEMMTEELKLLTGATLLARDKEFIVLYRGKDFLPPAVSSAIAERRSSAIHKEKLKVHNNSSVTTTPGLKHETVECGPEGNDIPCLKEVAISEERRLTEAAIKRTSMKLSVALENKAKAEKLLEELEKAEKTQEPEMDIEGITKEEKYMLRKIGLKMKPFLLLGRRGVFDGTVENMHLHWKYRELVKILCKEGNLMDVHQIAQTLEAESGGILVAVERVSKGYVIIVYRGKNYIRPARLRPQTLLNKKEAMKRSIEAQRRESLKLHVLKLNKNIDELKLKLEKDKEAKNKKITDSSRLESVKEEIEVTQSIQRSESTTALKFDAFSSTAPALQEKRTELDGLSGTVDDTKRSVSKSDPEPSAPAIDKKSSIELSSRSVYLSNKERLLLRRQALKMKKRPVLAVGKSNIVTGLAKAIKAHFEKHPLAIVNVKGRAKGTSVQEVVFKLEQATGAVLVSQEPSKVILYRGWGAEEKPEMNVNNKMGKETRTKPTVSPQLLEAIRIECGLK